MASGNQNLTSYKAKVLAGEGLAEEALKIGTRVVETAPSALTEITRLTLVPYYHAGGPWYIKSADDSSNAYLKLYYGTTERIKIKSDGTISDLKANITGNSNTATSAQMLWKRMTIAKGTKPSSDNWGWSCFEYETGTGGAVANRVGGGIETCIHTTGTVGLYLRAYQHTASSTANNAFAIYMDQSGNATYSVSNAANFRSAIGVGASGTHADSYFALASHTHSYLPLAGGTITGQIQKAPVSVAWVHGRSGALVRNTATTFTDGRYNPIVSVKSNNGSWDIGSYSANNSLYFTYITDANFNSNTNAITAQVEFRGSDNTVRASKVYGAVWNDYAEYRAVEEIGPGRCVSESKSGKMKCTQKRLEPGCKVTSDTFGFAIGETEECTIPVAVSGRVLVYPYSDPTEWELGSAVCSAPGGTIDIMTREEIMKYPERIVGTISEIPDYEEWHAGSEGGGGQTVIKVDGRIWIYVR